MSLYTMERKISLGEPVALSTVLKSKRQVDRLGSLVNDLLDVSRVELGKLGLNRLPIDLTQLVVEVAEQFRGASDRELWIQVPAERVWVMGDRDRLEQVLVNLLENAQKYSPPAEPVAVTLETGPEDAFLRVVDHGIGIPLEDQEKIFERFHRAQNASHRHFAGLGLGLFISESVMRMHEGELKVSSAEGNGSTFLARLPRLSAAHVAKLPRRVLLLEENKDAEREAATLLQAEGFEVHGPDTQESLRNLVQAPLDAIILSTTLEPKVREHFLQTLTSLPLARPIPLLFCGEHVPGWATSEGAVLCSKPYERVTLLRAIEEAQSFEPAQSAWGNPVLSAWDDEPHHHPHHH